MAAVAVAGAAGAAAAAAVEDSTAPEVGGVREKRYVVAISNCFLVWTNSWPGQRGEAAPPVPPRTDRPMGTSSQSSGPHMLIHSLTIIQLLDNPAPTGNGQSESTHGDSLLVGQAQSGGPVIQYPQGDDPGRQARDEGPGIGGSRGGGSVMRCRRGGGPVIRYTHGDDPVDRQAQGDSPGIGGIRDGGPVTRRPQDDGSEWEVNPFTELPAREEEVSYPYPPVRVNQEANHV